MKRTVRRGDIYYAKLDPHIGSEQGGTRPVLILSNDTGNRFSPTVLEKFQIRRAVLTPEGTHPHNSGLFLPLSIFPNSNFVLITCKLEGIKHLKISRNTEVQDNILMP